MRGVSLPLAVCLVLLFFTSSSAQDYRFGRGLNTGQVFQDRADRGAGFGSSFGDSGSSLMRPYQQNSYGPGIHSDSTGRPFIWSTRDGQGAVPGAVRPDAYGLGVGMDPYGRPVKKKKWP